MQLAFSASQRASCALFICVLSGSSHAQIAGGNVLSPPGLVNRDGASDSGADQAPVGIGVGDRWVVAFQTNDPALSNGSDFDVVYTTSRDRGLSWSAPTLIMSAMATDSGLTSIDVDPALATDLGHRIIVWTSSRGSASGVTGIYSAYHSQTGTTWVSAAPISAAFASDGTPDVEPVIGGAVGTWICAWQRTEGLNDGDIYFARSVNNGGAWTAPARLNAASGTDTGQDINVSIATDRAGRWVIVHQTSQNHFGTGTDYEVIAYRSTNDGVTWTGPILVNSTAGVDGNLSDVEPTVVYDTVANAFVCAWRTFHTFGGTTGPDSEIACSRSTDDGATWAAAQILNTDFATDNAAPQDAEPALANDAHGVTIATWTRTQFSGTDKDIYAARSDDGGITWTPPVLADIDAVSDAGTDQAPFVCTNNEGNWLVLWESTDQNAPSWGPDADVLAMRFMQPLAGLATDYCFGYMEAGTPSVCPCANESTYGSHEGCQHSGGRGAELEFFNPFNVSSATEPINVQGTTPGAAILLFQGDGVLLYGKGMLFGDGRLCAGGSLDRLAVVFASSLGSASVSFVPTNVVAGQTRHYQAWYRDSAAFCTGFTYNMSSAIATVWLP